MPFPFVERPRLRSRPALLVTTKALGGRAALGWTLMITSAENAGWPDDVSLETRFAECGLPVPCVVRVAKIATVELAKAERLGRIPDDIYAKIVGQLRSYLAEL